MNLVMRGIKPDNIVTRNGDTLEEDWPYFDENDPVNTYDPLYVDAVVSNPPYSQAWDPSNKEQDSRYARFGLAPKGKADYAFLLHDLYHLKPDGIMTIVLPHGVLFRGGEEGEIRKNLIEHNHIDAIIGLPANIFFGTGIPTIVMVLKQKRINTDVLIIDASKGFIKEGKNNKLRASDIKRISDTVIKRESIEKFSRVVTIEEIRSNEYNLNIPRYVDASERTETWDIYASMFGGIPKSELDELKDEWLAFPELRNALFTDTDTPYVQLATDDLKAAIKGHPDVLQFKAAFTAAFSDFKEYLKNELINKMTEIAVSQEETILSDYIFERLKSIPLIDKYEAYQLLDDEWCKIAVDLEMIQTEGFSATKKVDPNIVLKKKDGKDQEVQEGWIGHIMPFELVQDTLLQKESRELRRNEARLSEIPSEYEEIADALTEEEKDGDYYAGEAFVPKEVTKKLKELKADPSAEATVLKEKLARVEKLVREEKELKAQIRKDAAALHALTKDTIERLSDEQIYQLLEKKWILSLTTNLDNLPDRIIDSLINKIQSLHDKYAVTYFEIEKQIKETEDVLCSMIDELEGNEFDMKGLDAFKRLLRGE